jgi:hypothetical protein
MAKRVSNSDFGVLLKGSDVVDAGKRAIAGIILAVRDSPQGFGSPYIIDFDNDLLPGIHSWPCNVTSARRLADLTKFNDPDKWEGFALGLEIVQVNNPKLARVKGLDEYLVDSLAVSFVTDPKVAAKKRKSKPKYKKELVSYPGKNVGGPAPHGQFTDDDVPF